MLFPKHLSTCSRRDKMAPYVCSAEQYFFQGFISLRRIEKYLHGAEVNPVPPLDMQSQQIALQNATITWPQDRLHQSGSATPSAASTPRGKFMLLDLALSFPEGELSLVCGKLGSGKTLLLLGMHHCRTDLEVPLMYRSFSTSRRSGYSSWTSCMSQVSA